MPEILFQTLVLLLLTVLAWKMVPEPKGGPHPGPAGFLPTLSVFAVRAGTAAFVTGACLERLWLVLAGIVVMLSASGLLLVERWRTAASR